MYKMGDSVIIFECYYDFYEALGWATMWWLHNLVR